MNYRGVVLMLLTASVACTPLLEQGTRTGTDTKSADAPAAAQPPVVSRENARATDDEVIVVPLEMPGADVFSRLDANSDGFVSREEAVANDIAHNFDRFDSDGDGRISATEYHIFTATPAETGAVDGRDQPERGENEKWDTRTY